MSLPHIFLQFIFILRKGNRKLFLNLREWKCVYHEGWCYSLILGGCLAKRTSRIEFYSGWHESTFKKTTLLQRDSIALWNCSKLFLFFLFYVLANYLGYYLCIKTCVFIIIFQTYRCLFGGFFFFFFFF